MGKIAASFGIWRGGISLADPPPPLDAYEKRAWNVVKAVLAVGVLVWVVATVWWLIELPADIALLRSLNISFLAALYAVFSLVLISKTPSKCGAEEEQEIVHASRTNKDVDAYRLAVVASGRRFYSEDFAAICTHLAKVEQQTKTDDLMKAAPLFRAEGQ